VTLLAGLGLQVAALGMLAVLNPTWTAGLALGYVMAAQALSGIAKDLTKMSSKSAIKRAGARRRSRARDVVPVGGDLDGV